MKKIIIALLIVFMAGAAFAGESKVGTSGAQFLKIGVGSRYNGMGEASSAIANDIYSTYWNPAGLAQIENWSVGFTNVNWFLDIDLNYFGFARYFEDVGTFGMSATVLSMDEQEITTFEEENGTGQTYTAASYSVGVSYARQLTAKFAFGASFKYVGERIDNENASTFAFDFGTMMHTGWRTLRFGMCISNMGPEMKFSGSDLDVSYDELEGSGANQSIGATVKTTEYELPMIFRFGIAYDVNTGAKSMLTLSGELKHPNDFNEQGSIGAEWAWDETFFVRSGYKMGYDEETFSVGAGLSTNISNDTQLLIDYSWQDFGRLDNTQRFSVGFSF